ncbi:MAG: hypothetical protein NQ127_04345 [Candidatus Cardinium sp.]|nr:hypothetical protein [Candidatus Cardinium sp.]
MRPKPKRWLHYNGLVYKCTMDATGNEAGFSDSKMGLTLYCPRLILFVYKKADNCLLALLLWDQ